MATTTTNLGLTKPAVSDAADISVLNANFDKIDALGGYGLGKLGGTLPVLSDCHGVSGNGWYHVKAGETQNSPASDISGVLRADVYGWAYMTLTLYTPSRGGILVFQKHKTSDGWQEWEYVNPPMKLGTEYRTTERWQGKAVYTMLVDIGLLPNASSKYASGVLPAGIYVTSIIGSAFSGYNSVPIQSNGIYVSAQGEWGTLYISTTSDYSAFTGYVTVKYTKN